MNSSHTSKTVAEILSQPDCWDRSLKMMANVSFDSIGRYSEAVSEWIFVGCGTSYYLAQVAAAAHSALTGTPARAVPASELFLYSVLTLRKGQRFLPVLISRSGQTSEVLRAAEFLKARGDVKILAITCDGNKLKELADWTIQLPVHEESTVMTSSFSSMLLALQYLSAYLGSDKSFIESLRTLPSSLAKLLEKYQEDIRSFVRQHSFTDYVYLGQGPFVGIAAEAALKVMEASCSYAQSFHTMEFRHGPKSIVSPTTMLGFFLSNSSYAEEIKVLLEMYRLGGVVFAIANRVDESLRRHSHLLIELGLDVPELAQLAPAIVWGQLVGVLTGIQKGLNPDSPKNLTRAVLLGE